MDEHGFNLPGAIPVETEPGDVLVHAGNALHASRTGRGGRLRRTIYFGAFAIDPYIDEYQASHSLVKLHMQYVPGNAAASETDLYLERESLQVAGVPGMAGRDGGNGSCRMGGA